MLKKQAKFMFWACYKFANHMGLNRLYFNVMTFTDLPTQRHVICLYGMV
jgi:hypothetical protein